MVNIWVIGGDCVSMKLHKKFYLGEKFTFELDIIKKPLSNHKTPHGWPRGAFKFKYAN